MIYGMTLIKYENLFLISLCGRSTWHISTFKGVKLAIKALKVDNIVTHNNTNHFFAKLDLRHMTLTMEEDGPGLPHVHKGGRNNWLRM